MADKINVLIPEETVDAKIKEIGDTYMLIEISDGVRIRVDKTSVFASAEDAQQK